MNQWQGVFPLCFFSFMLLSEIKFRSLMHLELIFKIFLLYYYFTGGTL
jgi:hypothetical protein